MPTDTHAGASRYTPFVLHLYDLFVLRFSARYVWKCPTAGMLAMYDDNVRRRHLDVGVGSGFFLDNAAFPDGVELTLLDLNPSSLAHTAKRISRYSPKAVLADLLEPLPLGDARFGSIGLNYCLHCIPGPMSTKGKAFDHLLPFLEDDGVLFGSTVLADRLNQSALGELLCDRYNRMGIFSNAEDTGPGLQAALEQRFGAVKLRYEGCVGTFEAREPLRQG